MYSYSQSLSVIIFLLSRLLQLYSTRTLVVFLNVTLDANKRDRWTRAAVKKVEHLRVYSYSIILIRVD